ncbi:MAG: cupin domain-containing protein [Thermoleophilaceae bacterium]|nr:cupin domain-containing protein [Thermoleophilaceae bacterium]
MRSWDLSDLAVEPHTPRIIASTDDARAILLNLPAGEALQEHEVHERAWLLVLEGEVEIEVEDGTRVSGGSGFLCEFEPRERHEVRARKNTRSLLLLTPWPGAGHPGTMTLAEKRTARRRARERGASDAA